MITAIATSTNRSPGQPPREAASPWPPEAWRRQLAATVTDPLELLSLVEVPQAAFPASRLRGFPLKAPRPYIARMRRGDAEDPLLRQVLPTGLEAQAVPGYGPDPLAEEAASVDRGLLRKYAGRALLIATGACAVHCRYCFRRHFPYAAHRQDSTFPALAAVRADKSIREVILSGGDPLLLSDAHFSRLVDAVGAIDHVRILRVHTRLPVVIPQRVTQALVAALAGAGPRVVVVLHFNHGNEVDAACARALAALSSATSGTASGVTLLNQSVLLRGVNDNAQTLQALSERLFDVGVLPYYLHMPDAVAGTAHFDVPEARALDIHRRLRAQLPGYLVPRLVRERPGADSKQPLV